MNRSIYVTEAGYDDIGAILNSLGEGYKYRVLSWGSKPFNDLSFDDILFVNCHGSCKNSPSQYKKQLREFVASGGILYASDWAGAIVAEAFGDYLEFSSDGQTETVTAKVEDEGLKEILGNKISLNFDMDGWWSIIKVKKEAKKLLTYQNKPLLVSFKVDRGYVLYTSFHNKSQVSKLEKALLEYLVFKPLLSRVADQASQQAISANYTVSKEIIASTKNVQSQPITYPLHVDKSTTILSILSWEGTARFELILENPQHGIVKNITSDKSPIGIEVYAHQTGNWSVKINPIMTPYPNFPFALTLAKGREVQQIASNASVRAVSGQGAMPIGGQPPSKPVSQMAPLSVNAVSASNPVKGNIGVVGPGPVKTLHAPVLFPILNMGGLSNYEVRWMPLAGQDGYILQEASMDSFSDAKDVYKGNSTSFSCSKKNIGVHFYRVCSYKDLDYSPWSETQSTSVLHNL